jgi:hypothetical protein
MDLQGDFLSRLATDEDWQIARSLMENDKRFRLSLAYHAALESGIELNAAHIGRVLGVKARTIQRWVNELKNPRQ